MGNNPFEADSPTRDRIAALERSSGESVRADIAVAAPFAADRLGNGFGMSSESLGGVVAAADVARIVARYGLDGPDDVMLLGLGVASALASPPISDFRVGAIGLEAETGNLVLGGNVEFPGTHLAYTLHGEGFVLTRAFGRGTSIRRLALGAAHPCAHCRQYLSEFAIGPDLELIDPLGHRLKLGQLYPWPFDPSDLGRPGAHPGTIGFPDLRPLATVAPSPALDRLIAAGRRAHAPYSGPPGAIVLTMTDGRMIAGASVESVAFNPTIAPLQAAAVELLAHGYAYDAIQSALLGTVVGGAVDYTASSRDLLAAIAPAARLDIVDWRV